MKRFIEGEDRQQVTLLPECLDDYIGEDNPVRVIDAFVDELDLHRLGFKGADPAATGRPAYHPSVLLKIYIYGYLNRIQSSRRAGARDSAQRRIDVADWTARAGFQNYCGLPSRQWSGDSERLPAFRRTVPRLEAVLSGNRGHR
jgi:hypothetical protein